MDMGDSVTAGQAAGQARRCGFEAAGRNGASVGGSCAGRAGPTASGSEPGHSGFGADHGRPQTGLDTSPEERHQSAANGQGHRTRGRPRRPGSPAPRPHSIEGRKQLIAAERNLAYRKALLDDTAIVAPFDGLIVQRQRDPGDIAVPGSAILSLVSTKELWITAWVDETEMSRVTESAGAGRVSLRVREKPIAAKWRGWDVRRIAKRGSSPLTFASSSCRRIGPWASVPKSTLKTGRKTGVTAAASQVHVLAGENPGCLLPSVETAPVGERSSLDCERQGIVEVTGGVASWGSC